MSDKIPSKKQRIHLKKNKKNKQKQRKTNKLFYSSKVKKNKNNENEIKVANGQEAILLRHDARKLRPEVFFFFSLLLRQ